MSNCRLHHQPELGVGDPASAQLSFTGLFDQMRLLVPDRDSLFAAAYDEVSRSEGLKVIHTPIRAPQANTVRSVCTVRAECLCDRLGGLIHEYHQGAA